MTKGELLRSSLRFALGKIKLARHKLSAQDIETATLDVMRELKKHGRWKELDDEIDPHGPLSGPR